MHTSCQKWNLSCLYSWWVAIPAYADGDCVSDKKGRALCYEGLALLLEFGGETERARAAFRAGCRQCARNSRLLREAANFEKRQMQLEVSAWRRAVLC